MLNKHIFFLWLGRDKPSYVDWTISQYKKVNPDFKIDLIEIPSVKENKNEDFVELGKIMRKEVYLKNFSEFAQQHSTHKWSVVNLISKRSMAYIADIFRYYLLFIHGGIYIDADTFPTRPFDNELFSLFDNNIKFVSPKADTYFLCAEKGYDSLCYSPSIFHKEIPNINMKANPKFNYHKEKFLNCELKLGDSVYPTRQEDYQKWQWKYFKYYYFDHFFVRSWRQHTEEDLKEREEFFKFFNL